MNSHNAIQEELKALNSALPPVKKPVFSVPDGYFENFAVSVLSKIKENKAISVEDELADLSPLLAGLSKKMPLSVPENYFTSLANEIPVLIGNDPLPSILQEVCRKNPYTFPSGYFENLSTQILNKVTAAPGAKVVSIGRPRWMRMAAAAVVIGIIALGSILYFGNNGTIDPNQQPGTWIAKKLQDVSDKALEEFVNTADVTQNGTPAKTPARAAEVRSLLKDVSNDELDDFLAELPNDDDELILIN